MDAKSAREIAIGKAKSEISEIENRIREACGNREMCITVDALSSAAKESLIENGFKVDDEYATSYGYWTISW